MDNNSILSILETIPKYILLECAKNLFLENKKFVSIEKFPNERTVSKMPQDSKAFSKDLITTYEIILDLIKINGDSGIVNKKRKETYQKAIEAVKSTDTSLEIPLFTKKLTEILTDKPKKIMKELLANGEITLEDKPPYNGTMIRNGKVIGSKDNNNNNNNNDIEAFKNLSILVGIGIGIGDSGIKDLMRLGYKTIEELRDEYEYNNLINLRKGLQNPLRKYFEGTVRIEKMSRNEATKWRDTISNIIDEEIEETDTGTVIKHKIAGSYARKKEEIGDIDYLIVVNNEHDHALASNTLYKLMNKILDKITEVTQIGNKPDQTPVELDSVTETPSKPVKGKRYSASIKVWFKVGALKTKVEIYGYSNTAFSFPYFARSAEINLQKKVKMQALRKGYKLSPWSLELKDTDISIERIPEQVELIREKLGKDKIETIKEIFEFLDFSSGNN